MFETRIVGHARSMAVQHGRSGVGAVHLGPGFLLLRLALLGPLDHCSQRRVPEKLFMCGRRPLGANVVTMEPPWGFASKVELGAAVESLEAGAGDKKTRECRTCWRRVLFMMFVGCTEY